MPGKPYLNKSYVESSRISVKFSEAWVKEGTESLEKNRKERNAELCVTSNGVFDDQIDEIVICVSQSKGNGKKFEARCFDGVRQLSESRTTTADAPLSSSTC
ncbi:unnamed protein product, partial [Trichobilharzia regenti]